MEIRIMRKHLIGTILVLAALTACNKEVDTPAPAVDNGQEEVTPGKVTLTFKAAIDEETRTTYANDKTASWAAGDKISVCLTDSESYDVVDFTTEDGVIFTGEVNPGYTTPVSAIYPANEVYTTYSWNSYFSQDDGSVTAVRLADGYELGSDDDPGKFIPLIGSYDGETMTFHHFCNTLKVTLTNIPEDAAYFTFATNKQKLVSDFSLTGGRMGLVSQEDDVDTSVYFEFEPGSLTTRSFYIPVPDGTLAANSYVALQDGGGADLFKKRITSSPTFGLNANEKDAIRVLPSVACWTRNENWNAYYYGSYKTTAGAINKRICLENMTGSYQYEVLTGATFNDTYGGSVANYLSSAHFEEYVRNLTQSYSAETRNLNYSSLSHGTKYVIVFGLDTERKFTGEYNCIEVVYPAFSTPEGWSISIVETDNYPIKFEVPSGVHWQNALVKETSFTSSYNGDLEYFIYNTARSYKADYEADNTKHAPRTGNLSSKPSGKENYIIVSFGIDDDYRPTGEYCMINYSFEDPLQDYLSWIGTWNFSDNSQTDIWTITGKVVNHSYTVTGIAGKSEYSFELIRDSNNVLSLSSQLSNDKYGSSNRDLYLLTLNSSGNASSTLDRLIMTLTMDNEENVSVNYSAETAPGGYALLYKVNNLNYIRDALRYNSNTSQYTMIRVTE